VATMASTMTGTAKHRTPRELLAACRRAQEKLEKAEAMFKAASEKLAEAIRDAAAEGLSDAVISEAMGVTRQRVYQRRVGRAH
jgi:DNA-directed RNA polymerase specialized sigma24 family protein